MPTIVAIYLFPEVEVLDFAGPFEVFTTASRVSRRRNPAAPGPFRVVTVARSAAPVQARAGLKVLPDHTLQSCPSADLLLVPGGVIDAELLDEEGVVLCHTSNLG
jgi:transcriptional regulator GlxA family with amidase domain